MVEGALGFRVRTGRAIAVLVGGPVGSPRVLHQSLVALSDPTVPESVQPYHAAMGMPAEEGARVVERLEEVVHRVANDAVAALLTECREAGCEARGAALLVGSLIDPATIRNAHIGAHAREGRLFRTALEDSLRSCGLACSIVLEWNAYASLAAALDRSEDDLKRALAGLPRPRAGPWRADEKLAALAGWMALARERA